MPSQAATAGALTSLALPKVSGEETDGLVTGVDRLLIYALAVVAVTSSLFCIVMQTPFLVDFASMSVLLVAGISILQKIRLSKLGSIRDTHNHLRYKFTSLAGFRAKYKSTITDLEAQSDDLQKTVAGYADIQAKYKGNIDRISQILDRTDEIHDKMRSNAEAKVMQIFIEAALRADRDNTFSISKSEVFAIKTGLLQVPEVKLNEQVFDRRVAKGPLSLYDVMTMFRNAKNGGKPSKDNIFTLDLDQLQKKKKKNKMFGF